MTATQTSTTQPRCTNLPCLCPRLERTADLKEAFGQEHRLTYGYRSDREPVEVTNIRVIGRPSPAHFAPADISSIGATLYGAGGRSSSSRKAYFGRENGLMETDVVSRGDLALEANPGPVIVEEYDTTIVVPPGCTVRREASWNVILRWEQ